MKSKQNIRNHGHFLVQVLLLCPFSLQISHVRARLAGGLEEFSSISGVGVPGLLDSLGTVGSGQVTSLSLSGQNGLICSYKYHCRSAERPLEVRTAGSSSARKT